MQPQAERYESLYKLMNTFGGIAYWLSDFNRTANVTAEPNVNTWTFEYVAIFLHEMSYSNWIPLSFAKLLASFISKLPHTAGSSRNTNEILISNSQILKMAIRYLCPGPGLITLSMKFQWLVEYRCIAVNRSYRLSRAMTKYAPNTNKINLLQFSKGKPQTKMNRMKIFNMRVAQKATRRYHLFRVPTSFANTRKRRFAET